MKYLQNASLWLLTASMLLVIMIALTTNAFVAGPTTSLNLLVFALPGSVVTASVGILGLLVSWLGLRRFTPTASFLPASLLLGLALLVLFFALLFRNLITDLEGALKVAFVYGATLPLGLAAVLSFADNAVRKLRKAS